MTNNFGRIALTFFVACTFPCAVGATLTAELTLGPGLNLQGQQTYPFAAISTGPVSLNVTFGAAATVDCFAIDPTRAYTCTGRIDDLVEIRTNPAALIQDSIDFALGSMPQDDFVGYNIICGNTQLMSGASSCTFTLPVGDYILYLGMTEQLSPVTNAVTRPYTDTISATLTGSVQFTPEPATPVAMLLACALLVRRVRRTRHSAARPRNPDIQPSPDPRM